MHGIKAVQRAFASLMADAKWIVDSVVSQVQLDPFTAGSLAHPCERGLSVAWENRWNFQVRPSSIVASGNPNYIKTSQPQKGYVRQMEAMSPSPMTVPLPTG